MCNGSQDRGWRVCDLSVGDKDQVKHEYLFLTSALSDFYL